MGQQLYFDVNATTSLHPAVREELARSWSDPALDGNPASAHQLGQRARAGLEQARRRLAAAIDADPLSVVWTSGGTEANALALRGAVGAKLAKDEPSGLMLALVEHPCVVETAQALTQRGVPQHTIPVDGQGRISVQDTRALLEHKGKEIGVLSCMLASHELGNLYPVQALVEQTRELCPSLWVHCDAVQGVGKCPVSFSKLGVDSMALSAHKFGGPKGVGALIVKRGSQLEAQLKGGSQERGFRAGTPSPRLAMAMALAAELAVKAQPQVQAHCLELHGTLRQALSGIPGLTVLGDQETHLGNTLCLLSEHHRGQDLMIALDMDGFCVSTGAACSVGASSASPGIIAMGIDPKAAKGVLRLSWGPDQSPEDAGRLAQAIKQVLSRLGESEKYA